MTKTTPDADDLMVFTNDDGQPWAAFVYGEADPNLVAQLITPTAIEHATGYTLEEVMEFCTWPPRVEAYWLAPYDDGEEDQVVFCAQDAPGATRITGHRFYPQD